MTRTYGLIWIFSTLLFGCSPVEKEDPYVWIPMVVTATAYNSLPNQTSYEHSGITAWGDSLKPGLKYIAVSRDLLKKGLQYNTMVKIDGFEGIYLVKDKMHHRWRNRIDIYMGLDKKIAKEWGRKKIEIQYAVKKDSAAMTAPTESKTK
ncbi:hypothetical protein U1E44_04460 [Arenibacter sp. GZD96]|uniref:3D domain-containing protein n=1 Tax=Aurantibrevibacter litoralis TaxID=3106030 RepID=UPI002AFF1DA2|nr:hypothetical protein [Arenibacter sp. GZD-96]MEA1785334.1 hypothetical protein [Arenibacter sp. GZD-96]